MNNENIQNERELLCELYSFEASNGEIYYIKPATLADVIDPKSDFMTDINAVGIPSLIDAGNARIHISTVFSSPERINALKRLVEKYVMHNGYPIIFEEVAESNFNIDDTILLVKRLAGISG